MEKEDIQKSEGLNWILYNRSLQVSLCYNSIPRNPFFVFFFGNSGSTLRNAETFVHVETLSENMVLDCTVYSIT
jgi:hypothetical protein